MNYQDAISAYFEKFDEGPPIRDMDENEAIAAIEVALETGKPITEGKDQDIPEGART